MTALAQDAPALRRSLARVQTRRRAMALALALPLLLFLLLTLLVPIGALLLRAVENPEVADTLGRTGRALQGWDKRGAPPDAAYAALVEDLGAWARPPRPARWRGA